MHEDDAAVAQVFVVQDGAHDGVGPVVLPVQGVHIPLHRVVSHVPGDGDHLIVVIPVGRAEKGHLLAGEGLHLVVDLRKLPADFLVGELAHIFVVLAVVAQVVPLGGDVFDVLRVFFHPASGHEKCDLHLVLCQDIHDLGGVLISPGGVEGEGDLGLFCLHAVDGELALPGQVVGGAGRPENAHGIYREGHLALLVEGQCGSHGQKDDGHPEENVFRQAMLQFHREDLRTGICIQSMRGERGI